MRGNAVTRGEIRNFRLPCAGITLIRFYGYNLSLASQPVWARHQTPRELRFSAACSRLPKPPQRYDEKFSCTM